MKTAPNEMATRVVLDMSSVAFPPAIWKNTRYVGALSKTPDKSPVVQKNCDGSIVDEILKNSNNDFKGPLLPIFNKSTMGAIVIKIPKNSLNISINGSM